VLYDAVVLALSAEGAALLSKDKAAKDFVSDAFGHAKFIGYTPEAQPLLAKSGIAPEDMDEGLIALDGAESVVPFLAACGQLRLWDRELKTDLDALAFLETT
jgi:catalase